MERLGGTPFGRRGFLAGSAATGLALGWPGPARAADRRPAGLAVSANHRFLVQTGTGRPFFYLADTGWEIFRRLSRTEADRYLAHRARQGYTVIQAAALAIPAAGGLNAPNVYGAVPFVGADPDRPAVRRGHYDYWDHLGHVLDRAGRHGLQVALAPTWGDYVTAKDESVPIAFDARTAYRYGAWIGARYRHQSNLMWIVGGDTPLVVRGYDSTPVWEALAAGLTDGTNGRAFMTYHPPGRIVPPFHDAPWLDVAMMQKTGPCPGEPGASELYGHAEPDYEVVTAMYGTRPTKPVLNGEPGYENAKPEIGRFTDHDCRRFAYWCVFAGACGHAYGALEVWQMYSPRYAPLGGAEHYWYDALDYAAGSQLGHLRRLIESRPFLDRIPDQSVIVSDPGGCGGDHVQATRDRSGTYAFVYLPTQRPVTVDLSVIDHRTARAWWFDPRTGRARLIARRLATTGTREFTPPADSGPDWVLVLDTALRTRPPGR